MKRTLSSLILAFVLAATTWAGAATPPLGFRAGYTTWENINQFHFGGHAKLGRTEPGTGLQHGLTATDVLSGTADVGRRFGRTQYFHAAPDGVHGFGA